MITYHRLWELLKEKGISTYDLIHTYGISASQINRWKHGRDIKLSTLNLFCAILECTPFDILYYVPSELEQISFNERKITVVSDAPETSKSNANGSSQSVSDTIMASESSAEQLHSTSYASALEHPVRQSPSPEEPKSEGANIGATISKNLEMLNHKNGLTTRKISELSGVPISTIYNILYNKTKNPRTETISALAKALHVSVEDLLK